MQPRGRRWYEYSEGPYLSLRAELPPQTTLHKSHTADSDQCSVVHHYHAVHTGDLPSVPAKAHVLILPRRLRAYSLLLLFPMYKAIPLVGATAWPCPDQSRLRNARPRASRCEYLPGQQRP